MSRRRSGAKLAGAIMSNQAFITWVKAFMTKSGRRVGGGGGAGFNQRKKSTGGAEAGGANVEFILYVERRALPASAQTCFFFFLQGFITFRTPKTGSWRGGER
jgi:hypothetical protein